MVIYSNKLNITVNSSSTSNLEISNFNASVLCQPGPVENSHMISVSGTVLYNGKPLPYVTVNFGFCSAFDPTTQTFSANWTTNTGYNGTFSSTSMYTATPPGGGNCIVAQVSYNGMNAYKEVNVTVPWC